MTATRLPAVFGPTSAKRLGIGLLAIGLFQAATSVALTLGIAHAFTVLTGDTAVTGSRFAVLLLAAAGLALVAASQRTLEYGISERLGQDYVHRVRMRLWKHLERLPAASISGQRKGATILRFIGDLTALKNWVSDGLVASGIAFLSLAGGLVALFVLNTELGVTGLIVISLALALQSAWNRVVRDKVRELRKVRSRLATDIVERVEMLAVVQSANQARRERRRLSKRSRRVADAATSTKQASGILVGIGEAASLVLMVAILWRGSLAISSGELRAGALVAALVLSRYLAPSVRRLSRVQEQWMRAAISRRKLEQFLDLEPIAEPARARKLKAGTGRMRLRNVKLRADGPSLTAMAPAGCKIVLRGPNGTGKSTLLRALAGLERPHSGMVSLDRRDLGRCTSQLIRSAVALVSPDVPLLRGTLLRNLRYANPRVSQVEVEDVLVKVGLEDLDAQLPGGLRFAVGDGGSRLSLGVRQRIQLARALLMKPRVLLLDEADAGLDSQARQRIGKLIEQLDCTVVFVWKGPDVPRSDREWLLDADGLTVSRSPATAAPTLLFPKRGLVG